MLSFKPGFSLSSFTFIKTLLISLQFLPLEWYHLHIWGYWYFSWQSFFQHVIYPAQCFTWSTLHRNSISIGASASASVIPMNIQNWFPLGLTGLISLQSKGLSESSPAPQFKSISSLALRFLYGPTLTSIHDYWKNHSFNYTDLCRQSDIYAFLYAV